MEVPFRFIGPTTASMGLIAQRLNKFVGHKHNDTGRVQSGSGLMKAKLL